jgi:branched-chain amino acid transport system ATP-binding protein
MSPAAPNTILDINNIEVVYSHTIQVLRGLSLSVTTGQIVALLGSNGAGKTTTLKAVSNMLGLERGAITAGTIRFAGDDIRTKAPHALVRSGLFHVMEGRRIFTVFSVDENLKRATNSAAGPVKRPAGFYSGFVYF